MKILIVVNVDWYFWSHRLPLAKALRARGCEVVVVAAEERGYRRRIEGEGFRFVPLRLRRGSRNVATEWQTFADLLRIYRRESPALVHHVSIKPILYGSMAARLARRPPVINAVTGLGYAFLPEVRQSWTGRAAAILYRLACAGGRTLVLCQSPDDRDALVARGIVPRERTAIVRGSGVNVDEFTATPEPAGTPVLLISGRMLWVDALKFFEHIHPFDHATKSGVLSV